MDAGIYPFEVSEAIDKKSKSGNDMIELKLKIWDQLGHERQCFDYLLESMAHKLRHFCEVGGLIDKYDSGDLQAVNCIGKSGHLELVIQVGKPKPEGGYYPDKNSVKDYIKTEKDAINAPINNIDPAFDDSIPF